MQTIGRKRPIVRMGAVCCVLRDFPEGEQVPMFVLGARRSKRHSQPVTDIHAALRRDAS